MTAPASGPPNVREIPFNALPEAARQRLVDILQRRSGPAPAMETVMGKGGIFGFAFLAICGLLLLLPLLAIEFGHARRFPQEPEFILGYIAAFWMLLYGAVGAFRRWYVRRNTPFTPGVYLFATDCVDATSGDLKIYPMAACSNLRCTHHHTNGVYTQSIVELTFPKKRINFVIRGKQKAEQQLNALNAAERSMREAFQSGNPERIYQQDPFFDARMSPVWNDAAAAKQAASSTHHGPLARSVPGYLRWAGFIALGVAIFAAPVTWFVRNLASDEAAYRTIATERDARSYIRRDGNHSADVQQNVLPPLALRQAQSRNNVTALRQWLQEFPASPLVPEARASMHVHYERVKQEFLQQANSADAQMIQFMTNLLAWLEANGTPSMHVQYAAPAPTALQQVDADIRRRGTRSAGMPIAPIAPHFTVDQSRGREQQVTRALQDGFGAVFPGEILTLTDQITAPQAAAQSVPTIVVRYEVRPSGATYTSRTGSMAFVGIHVDFQVTMTVPGQQPYTFPVAVEPPEHFTVSSRSRVGAPPPGGNAGLVYATMASRAFSRLGDSMANVFFRPGSPAHQRAMANIARAEAR